MSDPIQPPSTQTASVAAHYDDAAAGYHEQYRREQLASGAEYPANYFRLQILLNRIASLGARRVYDVGVGEGTPLLTLAGMGIEVRGCDISEMMVRQARERFVAAGLPEEWIAWADIQDSITFAHQLHDGPFDAVIAAGVLPHVQNDSLFIENLKMLLADGGSVLVEFRNKLFSLFTFNRKTREFILEDLLADVDPQIADAVAQHLDSILALDEPRARAAPDDGVPGYDSIPFKFHNPFELIEEFRYHGFTDMRLHWYHYHPAPPLLEPMLGDAFRTGGFTLEHDRSDWRGYFLCSAGVLEASVDQPSRRS